MNLILDIGNTSTKAAIYNEDSLVKKGRLTGHDRQSVEAFIGNEILSGAIVSSVRHDPADLISFLSSKAERIHKLTWKSHFPFKINYQTPETIGVDRLAAAAGAIMKHPDNDLLVIDAGSAVTFDIVASHVYLGGSISPGLGMRFRALHQFSDKLPLIEPVQDFSFPGTSTNDAISGGVLMGLVFEINEYIRTFENRYKALIPIITGGDGEKLSSLTDHHLILYPDLVADGLNYLLEYNAKN